MEVTEVLAVFVGLWVGVILELLDSEVVDE